MSNDPNRPDQPVFFVLEPRPAPPTDDVSPHRTKKFIIRTGLTLLILASLILPALSSISKPTPTPITFADEDTITLPIALYILVDDADTPDPALASRRTVDDLQTILDGTNEIWAQANITFEPVALDRLVVPEDVLRALIGGNFRPFFQQINVSAEDALLTGFYVPQIGGPNGIAFPEARVFFVRDMPSIHDRRVTGHEIGHILGLYHAYNQLVRLMASGTNGVLLTDQEIAVARYFATGLLNGQR